MININDNPANFEQHFQVSPAATSLVQHLSPETSGFVQLPAASIATHAHQYSGGQLNSPGLAAAGQPPTSGELVQQAARAPPASSNEIQTAGSLSAGSKIVEFVSTIADSLPIQSNQAKATSSPSGAKPTNSSGNSSASTVGAQTASKMARVALQIIRPKKANNPEASKQFDHLEQKIINQHARAYHPVNTNSYRPNGSATGSVSHQRIRANKQRDNNILNSLLSSRDGSSVAATGSKFDWPLQSVLDTLRSGVIKRSSIVKAMSDNRLARSKYSVRASSIEQPLLDSVP